jgi:hypothetical protein
MLTHIHRSPPPPPQLIGNVRAPSTVATPNDVEPPVGWLRYFDEAFLADLTALQDARTLLEGRLKICSDRIEEQTNQIRALNAAIDNMNQIYQS